MKTDSLTKLKFSSFYNYYLHRYMFLPKMIISTYGPLTFDTSYNTICSLTRVVQYLCFYFTYLRCLAWIEKNIIKSIVSLVRCKNVMVKFSYFYFFGLDLYGKSKQNNIYILYTVYIYTHLNSWNLYIWIHSKPIIECKVKYKKKTVNTKKHKICQLGVYKFN
jgi:hypothetical protein